jgi:hypothetical protein
LSRIMLNPPFRGGQDHLIPPPRITVIPPLPLGSERGFHPCIFQGYENPLKEEADGKEAGEYERDY